MRGLFQKARAELKGVIQRLHQPQPSPHDPRDPDHSQPPNMEPSNMQPSNMQPSNMQPSNMQPPNMGPPSALDILRYRYHHGTNLGSVFVIERWLQSSRFPPDTEGSSELAAVKAWVDSIGIDATRCKFEDHWANIVTDDALEWLVNEAKCTTIRLPIGYYDLPGPEFTHGTPFEPYAQVYVGAWDSICTMVRRLRARSIGVLIDFHALPGGANAQEHSGTNSGRAEFWSSETNRSKGTECAKFIAHEACSGLDIAGIQLVNEAEWESERMYEWYDEAVAAISAIDSSIPVIISDGWNLSKAIDYSLRTNSSCVDQPRSPVVIDTHYYWAFTDVDKQKSPQDIIREIPSKLAELDEKEGSVIDRGAVQTIVGEYSCVLTEDSWAKRGDTPKEELVKGFGQMQSKRYQQRAGGSFFWTWKMDWMPGGEWGFQAQTMAGNIVPPKHTLLSVQDKKALLEKAKREQEDRMRDAVQQHVSHWTSIDPHGTYEHEKYEFGWKVGYEDAFAFLEGIGAQGDRIGMLELWVLKRVRESGFRGGFAWLFEHGVRKGIQDFYTVVGI